MKVSYKQGNLFYSSLDPFSNIKLEYMHAFLHFEVFQLNILILASLGHFNKFETISGNMSTDHNRPYHGFQRHFDE